MKKIALVVFDIAGTTVKDAGNINDCFREAFAEAGLDVSMAEVDMVMGYRKIDAVQIIVEKHINTNAEDKERLVRTIHDRFIDLMVNFYSTTDTLLPLPHAEEIFSWLQQRQIKVALNTGFTRIITDVILKRLGWHNHPDINAVICSDEVAEGRPSPYMIEYLMKALNVEDAGQIAKVGDTEVDINEGKNAGCGLVVAVTTGAYTKEQLMMHKPDFIIDSLQQLQEIL